MVFGLSKSIVFCSATTFLFAAATASLSWCWVYGLGGAIQEVNVMIVVLSLVGWLVALWKFKNGTSATADDERVKYRLADLAIVLAIIGATLFVGLFPKMDTPTTLTMAFRTGPDAIGNSIGVDALLRDGTYSELETKILQSSYHIKSMNTLLDQKSKNVYTIPSLSTSVKAEFIMAGLRWGFSGVSANVVSLVGLENLWVVLALLPALSVLFGSLLIYDCLRSNKISASLAGACSVGGLVNVNFLHGWHEGGLAQAWVFISLAVLFMVLLDKYLCLGQRIVLMSCAVVIALPGYSDWFIVVAALMLIMLFIGLKGKQFEFIATKIFPVFVALIFSAVACGPYFIRFCTYIPRRLNDAGVGGWPMPVWTGLGENLGVFNPYNLAYPYTGHSGIGEFIVVLANAAVLAALLRIVFKRFKSASIVALCSVATFLAIIAFKTGVLDGSSNYQYFKAVGLLAPIIFPLIAWTTKSTENLKIEKRFIALLCLAAVFASYNYILDYRQTSVRLPHNMPAEVLDANRRNELDNFDILTLGSYGQKNIAPFSDFRFINRGVGAMTVRVVDPKRLGVLIELDNCYNWLCVNNVDKDHLVTITRQYRLLLLDGKSDLLLSADGRLDPSFLSTINKLSSKVRGPWFWTDFTPLQQSMNIE